VDAPPVNRETIVDWAERYSGLQDMPSLLFFRDHKDLQYGDSIDSFMTRIGMCKTVIRVISDKYLRSRYCMIEALRMDQYRDEEKRIFTIVWEDAELENEAVYMKHWKDRCVDILEDVDRKLNNEEYDHAVRIYRFMSRFLRQVKDEVHLCVGARDLVVDDQTGAITISEGRKEEFQRFIETVKAKLKAR
jgi:hypothetical protein